MMKPFVQLTAILMALVASDSPAVDGPQVALRLLPSEENPRNSEGDFITLKGGRTLFIYTHFTGGGSDASAAHLASRTSDDGGKSWSPSDQVVLENDADENIMSVSLLRLQDDRIALFYLRKNSINDCRPAIRFSIDEGESWRQIKTLFDSPTGWYCYTAIEISGDNILLGHCAGDRAKGNGLSTTQITRVPVSWLYAEGD